MNKKLQLSLVRLILLVTGLTFSMASLAANKPEEKPEKAVKPVPEATAFVTQHSGKFAGRQIRYTATAGETYLRDKDGEPKASIFSFPYFE